MESDSDAFADSDSHASDDLMQEAAAELNEPLLGDSAPLEGSHDECMEDSVCFAFRVWDV